MKDGMITRALNGEHERQVHINDVQIPDLWHVVMFLKENKMDLWADMILETWYLAHDMKRHIQEEVTT
jgi:hypothetical protein